ncbi:hypothetical protein N7456_005942 [Penicillium angulare]|uniref:Uncharacterized protein n=1 Tax=Penicillium angulare TaxID=116970 RepID=A0A9W9G116_9EURO|nr:hypothetical protein N7456_005942 [Penicillium angulare]
MAAPTSFLLSNIAIENALGLIKPESLEQIVQLVPSSRWLQIWLQTPILANINDPGAVVIQVSQLKPIFPEGSVEERQIFLVKCKHPSRDTPLGWDETENARTFDDLSQSLNTGGRLFAAVAIGTKVRFYKFYGTADRQDDRMSQLHRDIIDMDDPSGMVEVERMLSHVKENGW